MCDFCKNKKQLLIKDVPHVIWGKYAYDNELQVVIDRGYLRLVDPDDMQCMDHGEKTK